MLRYSLEITRANLYHSDYSSDYFKLVQFSLEEFRCLLPKIWVAFEHAITSIGEAVKTFGTEFCKFYRKRSFLFFFNFITIIP